MTESVQLFVVCAPGLESMLRHELEELEPRAMRIVQGGIEIDGDLDLVYRTNLEIGLAKAVRRRVGGFRARRFDSLVKGIERIPWASLVAGPLKIHVTAKRSRLYHTGAITQRVQEGIESSLGRSIEGDEPTDVHIRFDRDECTVSIDVSGEPLTRRGYRGATGKAPLSADLARALVIASGWDPETPLVDPFSGSGTIPIEATILARRLPPGGRRSFAFESAPWFDRERYEAVRAAAFEMANDQPVEILASDRDAGIVAAAAENATRAGFDITFERASISDAPGLDITSPRGALVSNPPFGHRLARGQDLRPVYQRLGVRMADHPDWSVGLLVTDPMLAAVTHLRLEEAATWNHSGTRVHVMVRNV